MREELLSRVGTIGPIAPLLQPGPRYSPIMPERTDKPLVNVPKVARLARLSVDPEDAERLADELSSILDYAERLSSLNLDEVEPLAHAADLDAPLAEDRSADELPHEELERNSPAMDGRFIEVPKVLGGGGGA